MMTQRSVLRLAGAILLLLSLAIFPVGVLGAATGDGHATLEVAMQETATEPAAEPSGEPPQDPPVDPATEPPAEQPVEPPVEPTQEPPVEAEVDPTEEPPVEPTEVPTEETPTEVPTEVPTELPTQEPGEPTAEPTVVPTEPGEELSAFYISKLFCATIDEEAEEPCAGRVPAAEGTTVYFEVTHLDSGFSETVPVEIELIEGYTFGSLLLYDAPFGTYRVTEIVPAGYEAFAVPVTDGQVAEGVSVTFELGAAEEEAFFVNVPFAEEPPGTTEPSSPAPDDETPPDVSGPDVTPGASKPIATSTDDATVSTLPVTGSGTTPDGSDRILALQIVIAALLVITALVVRRHARR